MSSTQRSHLMPFGVRLLNDGRVNFRLWAPGAQKVELCLQGLAPEACFMMASEDNGWYGIITEFADVGCYYQYRINEQLYIPDLASRFNRMIFMVPVRSLIQTTFSGRIVIGAVYIGRMRYFMNYMLAPLAQKVRLPGLKINSIILSS